MPVIRILCTLYMRIGVNSHVTQTAVFFLFAVVYVQCRDLSMSLSRDFTSDYVISSADPPRSSRDHLGAATSST